jgi:putative tricarboxylic transport membrane protein
LPFLPMVLGVVLGYLVESNYRRSLVLSGGDHLIFVEDRIALGLLLAAALFIFGSLGTRAWLFVRRRGAAAK